MPAYNPFAHVPSGAPSEAPPPGAPGCPDRYCQPCAKLGSNCHCAHVDEVITEIVKLNATVKTLQEAVVHVGQSVPVGNRIPVVGLPMAIAHAIHEGSQKHPFLEFWKSQQGPPVTQGQPQTFAQQNAMGCATAEACKQAAQAAQQQQWSQQQQQNTTTSQPQQNTGTSQQQWSQQQGQQQQQQQHNVPQQQQQWPPQHQQPTPQQQWQQFTAPTVGLQVEQRTIGQVPTLPLALGSLGAIDANKIFDPKMATDRYQFDGNEGGDKWKRDLSEYFKACIPAVREIFRTSRHLDRRAHWTGWKSQLVKLTRSPLDPV